MDDSDIGSVSRAKIQSAAGPATAIAAVPIATACEAGQDPGQVKRRDDPQPHKGSDLDPKRGRKVELRRVDRGIFEGLVILFSAPADRRGLAEHVGRDLALGVQDNGPEDVGDMPDRGRDNAAADLVPAFAD